MAFHDDLFESYSRKFGEDLCRLPGFRGEHTWKISAGKLVSLMETLRDRDGFDYLVDICSVDHMGEDPRYEVVYELCRIRDVEHLRIKVSAAEENPSVPSIAGVWPTANWHEREVFDMMGIRFEGHPDLRRIIMWENYPYHPLRKDFPLEGRETDIPDIAFSKPAPLEGGPFVTRPADLTTDREPRSRNSD